MISNKSWLLTAVAFQDTECRHNDFLLHSALNAIMRAYFKVSVVLLLKL